MCPVEYVAQIAYELHDLGINGAVYSKEPLVIANAVAVYRITDPEPETRT